MYDRGYISVLSQDQLIHNTYTQNFNSLCKTKQNKTDDFSNYYNVKVVRSNQETYLNL